MWPPIKQQSLLLSFCGKGYISIFGALAKLMSDRGANFESNIMRELCVLMGKWKVRTSTYHAKPNGEVEWAHQTLMCMIGKLSKDWDVDWPKHLPELVHAYNFTRLAVTRYNLHYLVLGHWPCLPINFYFLLVRGATKHHVLTTALPRYMNGCREPLKRFRCSPCQSLKDRRGIMIKSQCHFIGTMWLGLG